MEYRNLGSSGTKVSVIGLGTNNFGRRLNTSETKKVIDTALDEGINFLDTSNSYGDTLSEEYIGNAIKNKRSDIILATKVYSKIGDRPNDMGAGKIHIIREVENSLKRLQTDYIDLYQIHFWDNSTPIEETLRTLNYLIDSGKVRYIGCSNFTSWQLSMSQEIAKSLNMEKFITVQPEYSLLNRDIEKELIPACEYYNVGILPYFPLASGVLTGKYKRGENMPEGTRLSENKERADEILTSETYSILERLEIFAKARNKSLLDLAFAWLLANPLVSSVIAGATKQEQVVSNARTHKWKLSKIEVNEVNEILGN
jgi:aryl-alcohol dehydrogenase-like predicted oxidoreductase